jgi:hypothetical protein
VFARVALGLVILLATPPLLARAYVAGARAYLRDVPDAELRLLDTDHFALETHSSEIAALILDFMQRRVEPAALHSQSLDEEQARVANGMVRY